MRYRRIEAAAVSNITNPFADVPSNPYQSPTYEASAGPAAPFTREQRALRLLGPAIGLGISGILWLICMVPIVFTNAVDIYRLATSDIIQFSSGTAGTIGMILVSVVGILFAYHSCHH